VGKVICTVLAKLPELGTFSGKPLPLWLESPRFPMTGPGGWPPGVCRKFHRKFRRADRRINENET
jgi:hypothetical protein